MTNLLNIHLRLDIHLLISVYYAADYIKRTLRQDTNQNSPNDLQNYPIRQCIFNFFFLFHSTL